MAFHFLYHWFGIVCKKRYGDQCHLLRGPCLLLLELLGGILVVESRYFGLDSIWLLRQFYHLACPWKLRQGHLGCSCMFGNRVSLSFIQFCSFIQSTLSLFEIVKHPANIGDSVFDNQFDWLLKWILIGGVRCRWVRETLLNQVSARKMLCLSHF